MHERVDRGAGISVVRSARTLSFWEPLAARLHEFPDSPHDIFRPDRGRYPRLVRETADSAGSR
ncbi:hypothetical protein [Mycolicibacterium vaccae]|uniref:Hydrolase or acyltransferase of alpha/beta superfamily protein n=1 Tax=Mycolicibacterium vaccae ATCC 25954 TaxID=1194972 RepID=K0UHE0_MYCVA|nr:hydrolase or acyltransferase of alpha/beta superfamily protein [Mycolicibacterium vaccae 95051]EJZ04365.1 hydrolase or acyltransferase of alpha/beta superfamily protein [Mycolicibacterium vaccae ATCC 25954]